MDSSPIRRKLLLTSLLLILAALGSADFLLSRYTAGREVKNAQQQLEGQIRLLVPALATVDASALREWTDRIGEQSRARVTVIDREGVVLADSQHDSSTMDNHARRPEVLQAMAGKIGSAVRHSATLDADLCYVAVPAALPGKPGIILRLAVPLKQIQTAMIEILWIILQSSAVAMLCALLHPRTTSPVPSACGSCAFSPMPRSWSMPITPEFWSPSPTTKSVQWRARYAAWPTSSGRCCAACRMNRRSAKPSWRAWWKAWSRWTRTSVSLSATVPPLAP